MQIRKAVLPASFVVALATVLALVPGIAIGQAKSPVVADSIYLNGTIITVNDQQPTAEAIAVRAGYILAVGSKSEVLSHKGPATRIIDLHGDTLLPGFVDGHSHIGQVAFVWGVPKLDPPPVGIVKSIADIQRILREYIAQKKIPPARPSLPPNTTIPSSRSTVTPTALILTPLPPTIHCAWATSPGTLSPATPPRSS